MKMVMAEYYSTALRDLSKLLDSEEDINGVRKIFARITANSADRIDELQMQFGSRIEQNARLIDENMRLKNGKTS